MKFGKMTQNESLNSNGRWKYELSKNPKMAHSHLKTEKAVAMPRNSGGGDFHFTHAAEFEGAVASEFGDSEATPPISRDLIN